MTITAIAIPAGAIQVSALPIDYQWRGNWNQTTTYIINDKVFRGVSTWRAIAVNTNDDPAGQTPSGNWVLVAQGLDPAVLNGAAAIASNAATQAAASATSAASSATLAAQQISGAAAYASQSAASAAASAASTVQAQIAAGSATTSSTLAQAWAAQTSGTVDGTFYSAYFYATAASGSASAAAGSATAAAGSATSAATSASTSAAWAMQTTGTVDGTYYSARYYAQQAAASAQAAAAGGVSPSGTFIVGHAIVAGNASGTTVTDAGIPAGATLLPPQTKTGAAYTFAAADLYQETRRTNGGAAMADTLPASNTVGLLNGSTIQINNSDTAATLTLSPGSGTTIVTSAGTQANVTIGSTRSTLWTYDLANTAWRPTMNSLTAALLTDVAKSGLQIGDKLDTFRAPGSSWLKRDGSYYLSASYSVLAALMPGNGQSTLTQNFTEAVGGFNGIAYSPTLGIWVAVGDNQAIYWSSDRVNWTQATAPSATTGNYVGVIYSANFSAFGLVSSIGFYAYSTDGKTWTAGGARATTAAATCIGASATSFTIGFNNAGTGGLVYTTAIAGSTWNTVAPAPSFVPNAILNRLPDSPTVTNTSGGWILLGSGGAIATTPTLGISGTTYTSRTSNTTQALYGVQQLAHPTLGTLLYAVGANGAMVTSPDGTAWTSRPTTLTTTLRVVGLMNQTIRYFGDGGQAGYTSDFSTFGTQTLTANYSIRGVATDGTNVVLAANNTGASPTAGYLYNLGTTGDPAKGATQFQVPSDQPASGAGYIRALAA
jgi:hypothetical protein